MSSHFLLRSVGRPARFGLSHDSETGQKEAAKPEPAAGDEGEGAAMGSVRTVASMPAYVPAEPAADPKPGDLNRLVTDAVASYTETEDVTDVGVLRGFASLAYNNYSTHLSTMLLEQVWDYNFDPQTNVIDVHISRLRSKIDRDFATPLLHTVRGAGYKINDTP